MKLNTLLRNTAMVTAFTLCAATLTMGQGVGIGDTPISADADAMLEVRSTDKGFLPPRVPLIQTTSPAPMSAHVEGMVVYNTNTDNDVLPGLYVNDGSKWVPLKPQTYSAGDGIEITGNVISASTSGGSMPVGSIIAWHRDAAGNSNTLPDGWVECDGNAYPGDGVLTGNTPNLNTSGSGRFLRGGTSSGVNQDATFIVTLDGTSGSVLTEVRSGGAKPFSPTTNNYDASSGTVSCPGGVDYRYLSLSGSDGDWGPKNMPKNPIRPINMSVIWIIKYK